MGNVAASGGYWIATAADKIIAQNSTITGSIGVITGKPILKELWEKIGVNWEEIKIGNNALMWSLNNDFSAEESTKLNKNLDKIYADFKNKVAISRHLDENYVENIAKGQVWSGQRAKELKLVDIIGGYKEAIIEAKILAKIPVNEPVNLVIYPNEEPFIKLLTNMFSSPLSATLLNLQVIVNKFNSGYKSTVKSPELNLTY